MEPKATYSTSPMDAVKSPVTLPSWPNHKVNGTVKAKAPSNIALVKYWGKYGVQLPSNPSISFTLSEAHTLTEIQYETSENRSVRFLFEGKDEPAFAKRIHTYLDSLEPLLPFLGQLSFSISSKNTFPHSAGIASSASAMAAMALGICQIIQRETTGLSQEDFLVLASFLARLGSGSASRSVYPYGALWGRHEGIAQSSNEYAIAVEHSMHSVFKSFRDSILIVDSGSKSVSSSAGHALMNNHPFAQQRFSQANENIPRLAQALATGDMETFIEITEEEALTLHAMMMTSRPSYVLLKPGSLAIIEAVRTFRKETGTPLCFTIDAGPNIHLLYPAQYEAACRSFIEEKLLDFCHQKKVLHDYVGTQNAIDVA